MSKRTEYMLTWVDTTVSSPAEPLTNQEAAFFSRLALAQERVAIYALILTLTLTG